MSTSPTPSTSKSRRRTATWTGLAVSLAVSSVLGGTLVSCSDDGGNTQAGTTTTVDMAAVELDIQCELVRSYVDLESTRPGVGSPMDATTAVELERRRVEALDRMLRTLEGTIPSQVNTAADQLRALPVTVEPTAESAQQASTSLKQLTDYFDPRCGTEGGRNRSEESTTTLPPATDSTTSTTGGPASTDTTAATSTSG